MNQQGEQDRDDAAAGVGQVRPADEPEKPAGRLERPPEDRGHAIDWRLHDVKAKGVSDARGDKHLASGHKTQRMTAVYDRLPGKAPSTR